MKAVLLKAQWCKTCQKQLAEYKVNPPSVDLVVFDLDDDKDESRELCRLAKTFDVPTTFVFKKGFDRNDIGTWGDTFATKLVGLTRTRELETEIRRFKY